MPEEQVPASTAPSQSPPVETSDVRADHDGSSGPESPAAGQMMVTRRRVRRTPNFGIFMITGGFIGFLAGAIIASRGDDASGYSDRTGVALIGVLMAAFGVLIATIVALVMEKLLNRE